MRLVKMETDFTVFQILVVKWGGDLRVKAKIAIEKENRFLTALHVDRLMRNSDYFTLGEFKTVVCKP